MSKKLTFEQICKGVKEYGFAKVTAALSVKEKSPKELSVDEAVEKIKEARNQGKTVAFASGCFDIFHVGHVLFFGDCKEGIDLLFVGVDSDKNVKAAKGEGHPIFHETERLMVMASQEVVDFVFLFDGPCAELLKKLKPDFFCFSPFDPKNNAKTEDAMKAGAKAREAGYSLKAWSSSRTAAMIRMTYLLSGKW